MRAKPRGRDAIHSCRTKTPTLRAILCLLCLLGLMTTGNLNGEAPKKVYETLLGGPVASLCSLGDINKDGITDFAAGYPDDDEVAENAGAAIVYSGKNGTILFKLLPNQGELSLNGGFGISVGYAGDVNNDGWNDIAVGASHLPANHHTKEGAGYVEVFSGKDGSLIGHCDCWDYAKSTVWGAQRAAVCGLGDVNGDSYDDLLIGFRGWASQVTSGKAITDGKPAGIQPANWAVLYNYQTRQNMRSSGDDFGQTVCSLGDLTKDGINDFAIAAPMLNFADYGSSGYVKVYSGASGALLFKASGLHSNDNFGYAISKLGDVDGDKTADFIVGAPSIGVSRAGYLSIRSGKNGAQIRPRVQEEFSNLKLGVNLAENQDVTNDAIVDFVAAAYSDGTPSMDTIWIKSSYIKGFSSWDGGMLFGLATGTNVNEWTPDFELDSRNTLLANLGDINGDGTGEFAVSISVGSSASLIRVYSFPVSTEFNVPELDLTYDWEENCPRCWHNQDCLPSSAQVVGGTARFTVRLSHPLPQQLELTVKVVDNSTYDSGSYRIVQEEEFPLYVPPGVAVADFPVETYGGSGLPGPPFTYSPGKYKSFEVEVVGEVYGTPLQKSGTVKVVGLPWWCHW